MDATPRVIERLCGPDRGVDAETLEHVVLLAVELAREGREGRKIGTLFLVGDTERVLNASRCLILDPLDGHPEESKRIADPNVRETVKELAKLDGGFIVTDTGIVLSAARYFDTLSEGLDIPLGLGSRHMAAASTTRRTGAVAVVVSESSIVRLFDDGELFSEIIPELWLLRRHGLHLEGPQTREVTEGDLTVVSRDE